MRLSFHIAVFSALLLTGILSAPATGCATGTAAKPGCDFAVIRESLYRTESAASGSYTAVNTRTGAAGRYQFMPATREAYLRRHPECGGSNCSSTEQWISPACHPVQDCIMNAFTNDNLTQIRKDPACKQLLDNGGQTVTGSGQGKTMTCQVTESGLIAAFHLGGWDECRKILANGRGDNDGPGGRGGTDVSYYVCRHGGLPVPGNCTPNPSNTTTPNAAGTTGTQAQVDFSGLDLSGPPDALRDWWVAGLMLMAEQFTVNMAAQIKAVGMMFDAKHQLETQRLLQEKSAEAHKDYQPSEQLCTFGTFTRDLVATERTTNLSRDALSERLLQKELRRGDNMANSQDVLELSRISHFRSRFCDPNDNASGLNELCPNPTPLHMRNRDIDFTRTIDKPLSLDIDLEKSSGTSEDEESVFALLDNLFATDALPRAPEDALELRKFNYNYLNLRSIAAIRGIARNSIANIVAMKTATPNKNNDTNAPYLRALLREFGLSDEEIQTYLGSNPSYYAQMEFLTRKIYQNPVFYTNLYDKPANVQRIRAAMKAVKLMQDRDIHAALQRREMLFSMLLELQLRTRAEDVYDSLEKGLFSIGIQSNNLGGTAIGP